VRGHAIGAGAAAGVAILIRPNLVPLAAFPALLLMFDSPRRLSRALQFAAAVAPAVAVVGALNTYYYGSPLRSGYGPLEYLYSSSRIIPNLRQYARWFTDTQTAWPLLGAIAPFVAQAAGRQRRVMGLLTAGFPAALLALYLPYLLFHPAEWGYLRFLLPAYPALLAGFGIVVTSLAARLPGGALPRVPLGVLVAYLVIHGWTYARDQSVFLIQAADTRYARVVAHVRHLPEHSVVVSLAHSGPVRFYTGRDVLRFDAIGAGDIDLALSYLRDRGHPLYLVGDEFEIEMFRERFAGTRAAEAIAGPPQTDLGESVVYTLSRPRGG
jgi:hypothetical protein